MAPEIEQDVLSRLKSAEDDILNIRVEVSAMGTKVDYVEKRSDDTLAMIKLELSTSAANQRVWMITTTISIAGAAIGILSKVIGII